MSKTLLIVVIVLAAWAYIFLGAFNAGLGGNDSPIFGLLFIATPIFVVLSVNNKSLKITKKLEIPFWVVGLLVVLLIFLLS